MPKDAPSTPEPPTAGLSDADYLALGEFRRAIREFLAFSEAAARHHGLTPHQHQALLAIRAHVGPEAVSIGQLADSLLVRSHSAVELVSRLAEHGLVRRRGSEADKRRVLVELTPAGAAVLDSISVENMGELGRGVAILEDILQTVRRLDTTHS